MLSHSHSVKLRSIYCTQVLALLCLIVSIMCGCVYTTVDISGYTDLEPLELLESDNESLKSYEV